MNELREALIEARERLQNCWNAGQTFGYVREQAELGLIEIDSALAALRAGSGDDETVRKDANRLTLSFGRKDVCYLIDALEGVIEEFKSDGRLSLPEDYVRLHERLTKCLELSSA